MYQIYVQRLGLIFATAKAYRLDACRIEDFTKHCVIHGRKLQELHLYIGTISCLGWGLHCFYRMLRIFVVLSKVKLLLLLLLLLNSCIRWRLWFWRPAIYCFCTCQRLSVCCTDSFKIMKLHASIYVHDYRLCVCPLVCVKPVGMKKKKNVCLVHRFYLQEYSL